MKLMQKKHTFFKQICIAVSASQRGASEMFLFLTGDSFGRKAENQQLDNGDQPCSRIPKQFRSIEVGFVLFFT